VCRGIPALFTSRTVKSYQNLAGLPAQGMALCKAGIGRVDLSYRTVASNHYWRVQAKVLRAYFFNRFEPHHIGESGGMFLNCAFQIGLKSAPA